MIRAKYKSAFTCPNCDGVFVLKEGEQMSNIENHSIYKKFSVVSTRMKCPLCKSIGKFSDFVGDVEESLYFKKLKP